MFIRLFRKFILILLILFIFGIWMMFCDENSLLHRRQLRRDISELREEAETFRNAIKNDTIAISKLKDTKGDLEKYARENHLMKKDNEDIYIIVE